MLATMSAKTQTVVPRARGFIAFIRSDYPLIIGLGTAVVFLALGNWVVENVEHPFALAGVFFWLFFAVLWSAISVVRHANCLAVKCGEPYGTLILTLSAITIEVVMISAAVLHGANNPTFARDMMFAVIMIALNGLVGLSLLLGGLRHHEQHYNLQGANAYLNTIMALAVLGLVLPNFTTSMSGPKFSTVQEVFLVVTSLSLYAIFLLIQTKRHSEHFMESQHAVVAVGGHHHKQMRSTTYHGVMLFLYLIGVVVLAEKFAIPLDNAIERFGMPQALGGAIVAGLVLAPEALGGINAAVRNQLQRSVNILQVSPRLHRVDYPGRPDHRNDHESTGDARDRRGESASAIAHRGRERGYVWQRQNECLAGLHSPAVVRSVFTADILSVSVGFA
jgi:Ca2+:H+ antiporter